MGISSVGSFPVWSGGSLIFFELFRCRNLASNRVFSYLLVAGMFLYLGVSECPPCLYAPVCMYTLYVCMPPGCTHPHMPPYSSEHLCVFGGFACCGGCNGLPFVLGYIPYTTPVWGCLCFSYIPPHSVIGSLCIGMFQGYQYVMWAFPFC